MLKPTVAAEDAASLIFNLPAYRVTATVLLPDGVRHVTVETTFPPGCPSCGVVAFRVKERRCQRLRDIPVAGRVELLWDKRRWFCDEYLYERKSFCEATPEVPRRARSTRRLRQTVPEAVITSGRAVSETALAFGISWWLVQQVTGDAALRLPDVDLLAPLSNRINAGLLTGAQPSRLRRPAVDSASPNAAHLRKGHLWSAARRAGRTGCRCRQRLAKRWQTTCPLVGILRMRCTCS